MKSRSQPDVMGNNEVLRTVRLSFPKKRPPFITLAASSAVSPFVRQATLGLRLLRFSLRLSTHLEHSWKDISRQSELANRNP